MRFDRRDFLRHQVVALSGVVALRVDGSAAMGVGEEGGQSIPPGYLVVAASGMPGAARDGALTSGLIAVSTRDASWRPLTPRFGLFRISPDCRRLAILDVNTHTLWIHEVANGTSRKLADLHGLPVWSPDGMALIVSALPPEVAHPRLADQTYQTWRFKLDGSPGVRLGLPAADFVSDWSADGCLFLLRTYLKEPEPGTQICLCRPDGTERRQLTAGRAYHASGRFSPDSKQVVYISQSRDGSSIWVNGLDGKSPRRILHEPIRYRYQVCWAPDGERVAITRLDTKDNRSTVEVVILKTLERTPLKLPGGSYGDCDWRC